MRWPWLDGDVVACKECGVLFLPQRSSGAEFRREQLLKWAERNLDKIEILEVADHNICQPSQEAWHGK